MPNAGETPGEIEQRLKQAIDDAFAPTTVRIFLEALTSRSRRIRYIEEASLDLSDFFIGGAFDTGQKFEVNFIDPYLGLDKESRKRVKIYYEAKVEAVDPTLKKEFQRVFRM